MRKSKKMKKIVFVCLGNICRSAMAQGILEAKAKEEGIKLFVDSAGTSDYHIGNAPDERMQAKALEYDIDISNQQARQFVYEDFEKFDYIFAMDRSNYNNVLSLAKTDTEKNKVSLFLNCSYPNENRNVPDPYYGGEAGFEEVYQLLDNACDVFIKTIR